MIEILASAAIVAVLASIIFSSISQAKTAASRAICVSNLRTVSSAILSYAADTGGSYPAPFGDGTMQSWDGLVLPYLADGGTTNSPCKVLQCPEDKRPAVIDKAKAIFPRSYKISSQPANQLESPMGVVGYKKETGGSTTSLIRRVVQVSAPSDTIMLFECFTSTSITPDVIDNWQFHSGNSMGSGWASARVTGYRPDGSKKLYHGKTLNYAMADGHVETRDLAWPYTPVNRWNAVR